ncbi:MAG TPA: JAB domain-containing protein [Methanosarcina sp.]|nr:JAB domain-containing protein [Methanosarcina sp.]
MKTLNLCNSSVAEIEINYRNTVKPSDMRNVQSSADVYNVLRDVWTDRIEYLEEFVILMLNKANKVLGFTKISQGGTAGCVVDPKCIFQVALKCNASSIILAHNHPSGNRQPSDADLRITKKLKQGGEILEIAILDHLIITSEGFYSFMDEGFN